MVIVHVVESLGAGVLEYIVKITKYLSSDHHIVVFGKAIEGGWDKKIIVEEVRQKFSNNVDFYFWEGVQRDVNPIVDFKSIISLHRVFRKIPVIDAIHLHSSKAGAIGRALFFLTRRKVPIFYSPNGAAFLRLDLSPFMRKIVIEAERVANLLSGKIICCSQSEYKAYNNLGIKPAGFINNGTEVIDDNAYQALRGGESKRFVICSVGRITYQKNPKLFNEIASAFRDEPNIEFVWIGDGELKTELKSSNIKVTGWIAKEQVNRIVAESNVYLSTALWEGLPFAVLEAMSLRKPLLLMETVGNVDLVREGVNGALFNRGNQAIQILKDWISKPEEVQRMGNASYRLCKDEYDAEMIFPKIRELYNGNLSILDKPAYL